MQPEVVTARGSETEPDMIDTLYSMIRDRDPQVSANAIAVLNEILSKEGGIAINQARARGGE